MAEPFGIVGVIGLIMQITQAVVQIGLDWKDAPDNVKAFMAELGTLKIVLSETNANIILNSEFEKAFHNRPSLLLSQLGPNASSTDTKSMLDLCRDKLEDLLKELAKRKHGHRLGWDNLKGAFLAKATRDSVENLGRQCQILNSMLSIDTAVLAASTYKKVSEAKEEQQQWRQTDSKTLLAIQSSIDQSESWQKSKEDQAILDWLSPIDYTSQQHDFIRRRQPGTGQWLLDAAEYQEWIRVKKKTLFCPGIPGAGKTILAAIVINDLSTRFTNERNVGLAYIYCNFKRQDEQGIDDLLANLLKQLSQGTVSLPDYIKSLYNNHSKKRSRPAKNEILRTLRHAASTFSSVFIIIDALDECQVSNGCRTELLSDLFDLQEKCQTNLFATSRFLPEVDEAFKSSIHLEIRASEQDVQKYLDGHLSLLPKFVRDNPELKNEVKCEIIKAVDGMFLLAQLYFNSLKGKRSPKAIRTALGKLVTGSEAYDYAYKEAMERIEGQLSDEEDLAKQVLYWIICAKRPLTTTELQHALAVEPGETRLDVENLSQVGDMIAACAGLVTADEESKVIRLVHYTTQEYFKRTQHKWFPAGEARITSTCITYLSFHSFDSGSCRSNAELEERLRSNMLYHYAAQNWGHHARVASFLSHEVVNFLHRERNLEASIQVLMSEKQYPGHSRYSETRRMTGLHTTAYFGIEGATIILLDQESLNIQDSYGRTPLSWAAANGHEAVVKVLLGTNTVEANSRDNDGRTPLSLAAYYGHEAVVKLLLDTNTVEANSRDNGGQTPLSLAATNEHEAVVKLLLNTNIVEVNLRDNGGRTPLLLAAYYGYEAVVELLLNTNTVEVSLKDNSGWTPLSLAAYYGHEAVIKLLLNTNIIEVDSKDNDGRTPLSWAAMNGHEAIVKVLLNTNTVEVDSKNNSGRTPLSWAATLGYEAIVKLLLDTNTVEVNSKDKYGSVPLSWAAWKGHVAVVKLLLNTNTVEVNSKDNGGRTPLSLAATNGHEAIVNLLLNTNTVEVNSKNNNSQTPLSRAAANGHEAVVKVLLGTNTVEANSRDNDGRTPLSLAAYYGHEAVVKLLLDTNTVEANSRDNGGQTPLSLAATNEHEAVVKLLLNTNIVEVNLRDNGGWTPLLLAAYYGYESVVELLLDTNTVEVNSRDNSGWTPLSLAAYYGHKAVVKSLLNTNTVEVDSKDSNGQTPLLLAAANGHKAVVELLIDTGTVEVNSRDNDGRTPLSWAAEKGHKGIVPKLLNICNVNIDSRDKDDWTPLFWAALRGQNVVMKLLLDTGKADVNSRDALGDTPLFWATKTGQSASVTLLLENGALTSIENRCGCSSLQLAVFNKHRGVEQILAMYDAYESADFYGIKMMFDEG